LKAIPHHEINQVNWPNCQCRQAYKWPQGKSWLWLSSNECFIRLGKILKKPRKQRDLMDGPRKSIKLQFQWGCVTDSFCSPSFESSYALIKSLFHSTMHWKWRSKESASFSANVRGHIPFSPHLSQSACSNQLSF